MIHELGNSRHHLCPTILRTQGYLRITVNSVKNFYFPTCTNVSHMF